MIGIIDYNAGNIRSVAHAFAYIDSPCVVSKDPRELAAADRIVFPGVGNARYAMEQLAKTGYDSFLKDCVAAGTPVLGICLGAQIIFDYSEEGGAECVGLLRGTVRRLAALWEAAHGDAAASHTLKIPHMGWNQLRSPAADPPADSTAAAASDAAVSALSPLFGGVDADASFYFVHSYVIVPEDARTVAAVADYGVAVPAAVRQGCVHALQFHPEKSGEQGLRILRNFAHLPQSALGGTSC